jgi:hypothetical protein
MSSYLVLLQVGFTIAKSVTRFAVRSYRTFSPLPTEVGGFLSAALSVGSRPPGVTWHSTLWSPDFPPEAKASSDRLTDSRRGYPVSAFQATEFLLSNNHSYKGFFFNPR